jgi:hypothetical protein
VRRPAAEADEDRSLCFAMTASIGGLSEVLREADPEAEGADGADAEEIAARDAVAAGVVHFGM